MPSWIVGGVDDVVVVEHEHDVARAGRGVVEQGRQDASRSAGLADLKQAAARRADAGRRGPERADEVRPERRRVGARRRPATARPRTLDQPARRPATRSAASSCRSRPGRDQRQPGAWCRGSAARSAEAGDEAAGTAGLTAWCPGPACRPSARRRWRRSRRFPDSRTPSRDGTVRNFARLPVRPLREPVEDQRRARSRTRRRSRSRAAGRARWPSRRGGGTRPWRTAPCIGSATSPTRVRAVERQRRPPGGRTLDVAVDAGRRRARSSPPRSPPRAAYR